MSEAIHNQLYQEIVDLAPGFVYDPSVTHLVNRGSKFGYHFYMDGEIVDTKTPEFRSELEFIAYTMKSYSKRFRISKPKACVRYDPTSDRTTFDFVFYGKPFQASNI